VCCDGEFLPFRIKKFDQIWALTSLQNLSDITQGLSEIARVRKNNAKIGITYLRKSIAKKDLQKLIQTYLGSVEFIEADQYDPTAYSEDWICFIYRN
ncbi:MAG: methyltransferase domain-containing protein, partial [Promethearchaeota archaeon]